MKKNRFLGIIDLVKLHYQEAVDDSAHVGLCSILNLLNIREHSITDTEEEAFTLLMINEVVDANKVWYVTPTSIGYITVEEYKKLKELDQRGLYRSMHFKHLWDPTDSEIRFEWLDFLQRKVQAMTEERFQEYFKAKSHDRF